MARRRYRRHPDEFAEAVRQIDAAEITLASQVTTEFVNRLNFAEALPEARARGVVERRVRDDDAVVAEHIVHPAEYGARQPPEDE